MPGASHKRPDQELIRRRMLLADENQATVERLTRIARSLGHEVVARELAPSGVAKAIREESPEIAVVPLHRDADHAIDLIQEAVEEGICPVIVQTNGADAEFAARAAERGAFALTSPVEAEALQSAVEVAVRRFEELAELSEEVENLEGALRRRAIVERAKGMLMERDGLDERQAFEYLRSRARATNRTLVDVALSFLER